MHPNIPAEIMLRHLSEQAARDRRIPAPRRPIAHARPSALVPRSGQRWVR